MTVKQLCSEINLQKEVAVKVIEFSDSFDFKKVDSLLENFKTFDRMDDATKELINVLQPDKDNIKILSCMLKGAADAYDFYKYKGISDDIYVGTMKCFTRFIDECYKRTGKYEFDREWWTARQVGCHLFRIGVLEYEIKYFEDVLGFGIHIPSDANFSKASVDESIRRAKEFFRKYFPECDHCRFRCCSWLLASELKPLLPADSNIINFQNRFTIVDKCKPDDGFIQWLYNTKVSDYQMLPENTTLQKNMKKYLLSGGTLCNALGLLKSSY